MTDFDLTAHIDSDARPWCSEADTARMSNAWSGEL
jgi:hypothetical protein